LDQSDSESVLVLAYSSHIACSWILCSIYGSLSAVEAGAKRLAQVILGASHLAQTVVPALLVSASPSSSLGRTTALRSEVVVWKAQLRATLASQAECLCHALSQIGPCLQVWTPRGAMYAMVRIRLESFASYIANDMDFTKLLLQEENVMVLPGTCFGMSNCFRVVFCAPNPVLLEAAKRIREFCQRHCIAPPPPPPATAAHA
jgi:tyrosine aminotransferase